MYKKSLKTQFGTLVLTHCFLPEQYEEKGVNFVIDNFVDPDIHASRTGNYYEFLIPAPDREDPYELKVDLMVKVQNKAYTAMHVVISDTNNNPLPKEIETLAINGIIDALKQHLNDGYEQLALVRGILGQYKDPLTEISKQLTELNEKIKTLEQKRTNIISEQIKFSSHLIEHVVP